MKIVVCEDNLKLLNLYKIAIKQAIGEAHNENVDFSLATANPHHVDSFIDNFGSEDCLYFLDIEFASEFNEGLLLARKAAKKNEHSSIVFISAYSELKEKIKSEFISPVDFIDKSLGLEYVMNAVKHHVISLLDNSKDMNDSDISNDFLLYQDLMGQEKRIPYSSIDVIYLSSNNGQLNVELKSASIQVSGILRSHLSSDKFVGTELIKLNLDNILKIDETSCKVMFKDDYQDNVSMQMIELIKNNSHKLSE